MAEALSALECPVCSEEPKEPKLLPCNHVVCSKCVVDWLKKAGKEAGCPLCRAPILPPTSPFHEGGDVQALVDSLPTDLSTVAKVEGNKVLRSQHVCMFCDNGTAASSFCFQCYMKLCRPCVKGHKKFPAMKNHVVEELDDLTPERLAGINRTKCKSHEDGDDSLAEVYCSTHGDLVCMPCAITKHDACTGVKPIKTAATDKRQHFRREAQRLREKEGAMRIRIKEMKDKLTDNHGAMDREFEELQRCVERRHQHFRQLMQEEEDRVRLSSLEGVRAAALSQAGVLDGLVGSSPDDALLGSERTMLSRLAQLDAQAAMMDAIQDPVTIMPDPHKLRLLKSAIATLNQVQDQAEVGRENKVAVITTDPTTSTGSFTTPSGVKVSVYKTDITKLPVDTIVNAVDEHLAHGGGVALAISLAAGFTLEDEVRQHLAKHGLLRVTEVVETSAGALPCKKVLHAVGPRWGDYTDKALCGQHLVDTVFNCLQKADSLGFKSIALPSISAAIFGVPQDVCADSYLSAVKKFDERHGHSTSVRHVHFVNVNDAMISTIYSTFTAQWSAPARITADSQAGHTTAAHGATWQETTGPAQSLAEGVPQRPWDIPPTSEASQIPQKPSKKNPRSKPHQAVKTGVQGQTTSSMALSQQEPVGFPSTREVVVDKEHQVQISFKDLNVTLILQGKSVVDMETESVILWQDVQNIMKDGIWKQFSKRMSCQAVDKAKDMKKSMSTVDNVVDLKTANKQFVFIVLSFKTSYDEDRIRDFVEKALNKVDLAQKTTVAMTRMVKQKEASNKDLEAFIKGLYRAVKNYGQRATRTIREIHIAETEPGILQSMVDTMEMLVVMDRCLQDQTPPRPSSVPARPLSHLSQSPDPCAICKDKPSDPKPLPCGHVFCKHCIDQWFQSNPTCPVCNAIHSIISGDQPEDGRMKMTYSCYYRCEGFPPGMYTVEYSFPPGTQKEYHPNPGRWYIGTDRKAYLPGTPEGRKVLMLLKVAFDRRLIFTIGRSVTTRNVGILWNDIHHKTQTSGGPESYPDPDYLVRVLAELADKGVTEKDLTDTHRDFIDNPVKFHGGVFSYGGDFNHHFKA